jgi:hypothetical protein
VLSFACNKIAGAVPTWSSLQVLESEVRASKNAEECPHLGEACCPYAGTGRNGERSSPPRMALKDTFRLAVELSADER